MRESLPSLCRLVVHDKLIALAEAIFGTEDIRIYASELWAKFRGAASYEQEHHRDYLNHTPLVPSASAAPRSLSRGRPATAPMSATGTPITSGLAATPGETTHSTRTGRHSSSRPACATSCCSASLRLATLTGPRRPSKGCRCVTQVWT